MRVSGRNSLSSLVLSRARPACLDALLSHASSDGMRCAAAAASVIPTWQPALHRYYASTASGGVSRSVYLTGTDSADTTSPVLIGMMNYFQRHVPRVGYFQPIGTDQFPHSMTGLPRHVELLHSVFQMPGDPTRMFGLSKAEAMSLLATGKTGEMMDWLYEAYEQYRKGFDLVLVEGPSMDSMGSNFLELSAQIASNLGAPAMLLTNAEGKESAAHIVERSQIAAQVFSEANVEVLGVLANMVPQQDRALLAGQLAKCLEGGPLPFLGAMPLDGTLSSIRLDEVKAALDAKVVFGGASVLDREVDRVFVASAHLETLLEYVDDASAGEWDVPRRPLVICSHTRADVIIALLAAHFSGAGPHASAILMTGAARITPVVHKIIKALEDGQSDLMLPILFTDKRTFDVSNKISRIHDSILPTSSSKVEQSKLLFDKYVHANALVERLSSLREAAMTPKLFMHNLTKRCQENPQHIILPESLDKRILQAAATITAQGIARITLLGEPAAVQAQAARVGVDISKCQVVDHLKSSMMDEYVALVVEARKKKNVTEEMARDYLADANYFATTAVLNGDADGMVSGATHTTANTIRPALQLLRTNSGPQALVSSVFFMCLPDKILVYGDCAVNVSPTSEQLATIAITSADTAQAFGVDSRVALLSYSTLGSGSGPEVEKVTEAARLANEWRPDLKIEGPIQYDAAVDAEVAAVKINTPSQVAGRATVCVFPDLNTGNNTYKAVQQSTGAVAIGPILQGLDKPVNDLSRGCTVADIINTVECTCIQALQTKERKAAA